MFNKLKQFKDLRDKAKQMQSALADESVTIEKDGVTIVINGNLEIMSLSIQEGLDRARIESAMKDAFNEGVKKVQKLMAQKMQEMGGLPGLG